MVSGVAAGVLLIGGCEPDRSAESSSGDTVAPSDAGPAVAAPSAEPTPEMSESTDPSTPTIDVVEEGSGPETIPLDLPADALYLVTVTYEATGESDPVSVSVPGSDFSLSGAGDHSGTHAMSFPPSFNGGPVSLVVDGEGKWTVHIQGLSDAPPWPEVTEGDGSMVIRVEPGTLDGATAVIAEHDGFFSATAHSYAGNPSGEDFLVPEELVVEFNPGTSRFTLPEETTAVAIGADSRWTLDIP